MRTLGWAQLSTQLFLRAVDALSDAELARPAALPGWTRRHVIAHVHFNAEALRRLVSWAATGVESRMYESPRQRAQEIEEGARLPAETLRGLVLASAQRLSADLHALPADAWSRQVVTAQGRTVEATEIPWMRARETAVHSVDLAAGVDFTDLPQELLVALSVDAASRHAAGGQAAALAAWLTGRTSTAPLLDPWL